MISVCMNVTFVVCKVSFRRVGKVYETVYSKRGVVSKLFSRDYLSSHWQKIEWSDLYIRSFMLAVFNLNLSFGLELGVHINLTSD
jgi:hypothetical protein